MENHFKNPFEIVEDININNLSRKGCKDINPKLKFLIDSVIELEVNPNRSIPINRNICKDSKSARSLITQLKSKLKEMNYEVVINIRTIIENRQYISTRIFKKHEDIKFLKKYRETKAEKTLN